MSSFIPSTDADFVTWINDHAIRWGQNQATIGLSTSQTTAFATRAGAMTKDWQNYQDGKQALIALRDAWTASKSLTRSLAGDDCRIIKTFAATAANPTTVFTNANIPAPKTPVSGVAPGQPTDVKATLNTVTGELRLTWKCNNPGTTSGTVYTVQRRVGVAGAWVQIGLTSVRNFIDATLTAAPTVQYQITAQRSGIFGTPSGPVTVSFGHASNGEVFVSSVKMAA